MQVELESKKYVTELCHFPFLVHFNWGLRIWGQDVIIFLHEVSKAQGTKSEQILFEETRPYLQDPKQLQGDHHWFDLFRSFLSFILQRKLATKCNLITSSQLVAVFHPTIIAVFYCYCEINFC